MNTNYDKLSEHINDIIDQHRKLDSMRYFHQIRNIFIDLSSNVEALMIEMEWKNKKNKRMFSRMKKVKNHDDKVVRKDCGK